MAAATVQQRLAQAERDAEDADRDARALEVKLAKVEKELRAVKAQLAAPQSDAMDLTRRLTEALAHNKRLQGKLAVAEARADAAEERVFDAIQSMEAAEADAVEADADAERFEESARGLERKCRALAAEVEQLTTTVADLQRQLAVLPASAAVGQPVTVVAAARPKRRAFANKQNDDEGAFAEDDKVVALHEPQQPTVDVLPPPGPAHDVNRTAGIASPTPVPALTLPALRPVGHSWNGGAGGSTSTSAAGAAESSALPASVPPPTVTVNVAAALASRTVQTAAKAFPARTTNIAPPLQTTSVAATTIKPPSHPNMVEPARVRKTTADSSSVKKTGKEALLEWCRQKAAVHGIEVKNFSSSFADGLAFAAIICSLFPSKITMKELSAKTQERNFTLAFKVAEDNGVVPLLDVSDMVDMERPDPLSVMTYCIQLYKKFGAR